MALFCILITKKKLSVVNLFKKLLLCTCGQLPSIFLFKNLYEIADDNQGQFLTV